MKGEFNKGHGSSRKSLHQRILESRCRLCNQVGHWKAEYPNRRASSTRTPQVPTSHTQVIAADHGVDNALPLEFLNLLLHVDSLGRSSA